MSYIGQTLPADTFQGFTTDSFAGDGSATTFTLSKTPFNESALLVVINNVVQKPTTNFTVSGTILTIVGTAVASGDVIYATHIGGALPIGQAASLDLNGASDQLILDADDSHSAGIAAGTITADATLMTLNTADIDISVPIDVTGASTITTADNSDTLKLVSTDDDGSSGPVLHMVRDSSSPADGDSVGRIHFSADNDAGEEEIFARIKVAIVDASNGSEDARMRFSRMTGGGDQNMLSFESTETVFNDDSKDIDFRVESDDRTSMLNVDAGLNKVGIGDVPDLGMLHVKVSDSGASVNTSHDTLVLEENGNSGISILSSTSNAGAICFGDSDNNCIAYLNYDHASNVMQFGGNNAERMRITAGGSFAFGTTSIQQNAFAHFKGGEHSYFAYKFETVQTSNNAYNMWLYNNYAGNSASQEFLRGQDPSAVRFFIATDGGFYGNGTYGSVSDERIKQDITDANSQWDDIKALKVRNFKKKVNVRDYGDDALVEIGLVAQEVEKVSPKLIEQTLPDNAAIISDSTFGTLYTEEDDLPSGVKVGDVKSTKENVKAIKYSIVHMKALKALQEAMTRIETLEAEVTALKG